MVNSHTALSGEVVTGTGLFSFADRTIDIVASHQTRKAQKTMNQRRFAANTMYREPTIQQPGHTCHAYAAK